MQVCLNVIMWLHLCFVSQSFSHSLNACGSLTRLALAVMAVTLATRGLVLLPAVETWLDVLLSDDSFVRLSAISVTWVTHMSVLPSTKKGTLWYLQSEKLCVDKQDYLMFYK